MNTSRIIPVAACLAMLASQAGAHAFIKTATPPVGSTVAQSPPQVVIDFTEGVEPAFSSIVVQDAQGNPVATGSTHLAGGDTHLALDIKPLPPGMYTVVWHATATDTHKTEGRFTFTVQPH
jgi:methionine-rich copper-binding protein CopC